MSFRAQPKNGIARARLAIEQTLASLSRAAKDEETNGRIQQAENIRAIYTALKDKAVLIAPDRHHAAPSADPVKATACRVTGTGEPVA